MSLERLTFSFVLGYHGCDREIGEGILKGEDFKPSENEYDWLGPGVYFWEANPLRGLEWAEEQSKRAKSKIRKPFVIGAVIDLGNCLDLSSSNGCRFARIAFDSLSEGGTPLPANSGKGRNFLDCAVIRKALHMASLDLPGSPARPFDTVRGIFQEGYPLYEGSSFYLKTHVQVAVPRLEAIKGVFRVPDRHLRR